MALEDIVNVQITRGAPTVAQQNFGRILILGSAQRIGTDRFRIYRTLAAMAADGYLTTDEEYKAATSLLSQSPRPIDFMVGRIANGEDAEEALTALMLVTGGDAWYSLVLCDRTKAGIMSAAAYIETLRRDFVACTDDPDVSGGVAGNVGAALKAAGYYRTALFVSLDAAHYPEASMLALGRAEEIGSFTYKFKQLPGITVDTWSPTQQATLAGYNATTYESEGGVPCVMGGKVAAGEWLDTIEFIDWLQATMTERVANVLIGAKKVPYTAGGITLLENPIRQTLQEGANRGGIAVDEKGVAQFVIDMPDIASVPTEDKQNRVLNGTTWDATLAGAIQAMNIHGTVHV